MREKVIADKYRAGMSQKAIAVKYGVAVSTLLRILKERGIPVRKSSEARSIRQKTERRNFIRDVVDTLPAKQLLGAYQEGASIRQLSDRFGRTRSVIVQALKRQGAQIRYGAEAVSRWRVGRLTLPDTERRRVVALCRQLGSATKAGAALNVSTSTVLRALRRWRVDLR